MKRSDYGSDRFYLIQRGHFVKNPVFPLEIMSNRGLVEGDYMGAAEYEWGAIPAAYSVMMNDFHEYDLFPTDIKHGNGYDTLLVWCRKEWKDIIFEELKRFAESPYRLKEPARLHKHLSPETEEDRKERLQAKREGRTPTIIDFWWEIQKDWNFMMFFSGGTRRSSFMKAIQWQHEHWWLKLTPEEREQRLKDAKQRMR